MDDREILDRADANLLEYNRDCARWTRGGVVHEEAGLAFFAAGHRFPVGLSGVMRTDPEVPAEEVLARTREWFAPRGHGYTFFVRAHRDGDLAERLEAEGVGSMSQSPGMVLEKRLPDVPPAAGVTIDRVSGVQDAREFADVCGAAYATMGMPPKIAARQFDDHRFFDQPHVAAFVARLGNQAVAAAMVLVSHGVAGVYWVGTTPEARGRGLAEACTRVAGNAGLDQGALLVALQASAMGEPIYRRMGYREFTRYPWYVEMP
jgi:GNAT superfamily N-acetyltransferase